MFTIKAYAETGSRSGSGNSSKSDNQAKVKAFNEV